MFGGYSSSLDATDLEFIKTLGILSQFRGTDSTGVIVGHNIKGERRKHIKLRKDVGNSSNFLSSKVYEDITKPIETFMVVGHTRFATSGVVNINNAHPFRVGNIFGVHNGTIPKHQVPYDQREFDSDSQVFFRDLQANGIDKAVENAGLTAALAVVYIDIDANTLNFYRNNKRPLFFMMSKRGDAVFWASEAQFLDFAERRSSQLFTEAEEVKVDTLHTVKIGSMDLTSRELVKTPPPPFVHFNIGNHSSFNKKEQKRNKKYYYNQAADADKETSLRGVDLSSGKKKETNKTSHNAKYRGYGQKEFLVTDILNHLQKGCLLTGYIPNVFERVFWVNEKQFIVPAVNSNDTREYLIGNHHPLFEGKVIDEGTVQ